MKNIPIVIIGAGYGAYEVIPLIEAINQSNSRKSYTIIGLLDDDSRLKAKSVSGHEVLGNLSLASSLDSQIEFVFAIGSYVNRLQRKDIFDRLEVSIQRFPTLIHPKAEVMVPAASIGFGCQIHSNVVIHPLSAIGDFCVFSAGSVLGVANIVGSYSLFAANVTTATDIIFGSFSMCGSSVTIAPRCHIGTGALIAVGATVFRDIQPGHSIIGNPGKPYSKDEITSDLMLFNNSDYSRLSKLTLRS